MTATASRTRLRKIATLEVRFAVATYAVLQDGKEIGSVTKYDMPSTRNRGSAQRPHYTPSRVTRWSADFDGMPHDERHRRRQDAVDIVRQVEGQGS